MSITVLKLWSASDEESMTSTASSPPSPRWNIVLIVVLIAVVLGLEPVITLVAVLTWQCPKHRQSKPTGNDNSLLHDR